VSLCAAALLASPLLACRDHSEVCDQLNPRPDDFPSGACPTGALSPDDLATDPAPSAGGGGAGALGSEDDQPGQGLAGSGGAAGSGTGPNELSTPDAGAPVVDAGADAGDAGGSRGNEP
jgi:hypothetical protein